MSKLVDSGKNQKLVDEDGPVYEHPGELLIALVCGEPVSLDDRKFMALAIERWMLDGVVFDKAVGLNPQRGGVPTRKLLAISDRDRRLRALWKSSAVWSGLNPLAAALLMSASARRYERGRWNRDRASISAPLSEPESTWWHCLHGSGIPGAKRLQQVFEEQ